MECVYSTFNKCGQNDNCIGCTNDPFKREMAYDEFRDIQYHWSCDSCKFCKPNADMDGIESPCKRLDHKHYSFSKAIFYSYDCGQRNGCICSDYEPKDNHLWLIKHFKPEFLKELNKRISPHATVGICIDHDWELRYYVTMSDFFNNTFINEDGTLKWIYRGHYRKTRKNPIGYEYVWEYPDGTVKVGATAFRGKEE